LIVETKDGEVRRYELEPIQTNDNQTNSGVINSFIEAIINDKEPLVTGQQALATLRVIEKLLSS
jgi:predicted dehydrogenase